MGVTYKKQIAEGIYPSKSKFEQFYLIDNHSIIETSINFGISTNVVKNLIRYFNLHKDKDRSVLTCARKKIENANYPSKDELLQKYIEFGNSWLKVGMYYGYSRITLIRLRKRYNLINTPNPILSNKDSLLKYIENHNIKSIIELAAKLQVKINQVYYWAEKHHITEQISKISSYPEEEIKKLLDEYSFVKDRTVIKPLEIDLFNKEKNIGIEYDGIFWHSTTHKDKNYHFEKSLRSDSSRVHLIHVFEDEWVSRDRQGLENFLLHTFSDVKYVLNEELCVKKVSKQEEANFNTENHYNGHEDSDLCLGLYSGRDLLQLISFNQKQNYDYEIVRDYPEINNLVPGGYEKILEYFYNNFHVNEVEVKCDFSKYNGLLYEKIGFKFLKYTGPKKRSINPFFKNNYTVYNSGEKIYIFKKAGALYD